MSGVRRRRGCEMGSCLNGVGWFGFKSCYSRSGFSQIAWSWFFLYKVEIKMPCFPSSLSRAQMLRVPIRGWFTWKHCPRGLTSHWEVPSKRDEEGSLVVLCGAGAAILCGEEDLCVSCGKRWKGDGHHAAGVFSHFLWVDGRGSRRSPWGRLSPHLCEAERMRVGAGGVSVSCTGHQRGGGGQRWRLLRLY